MRTFREAARVLRHRDYRWLWAGQSTSAVGDSLVFVALALFITDRTGNPTDLGLVLAAGAAPLIAFLLLGGVWADRLPRHAVVVVTDLICAALEALFATLIFTGEIEIWQIVAIMALFGTAEAFFRPAVAGLVPQTVPESDIQQANALMGVSRNVATFAGPALATALILTAGAGWAFAIDAGTFLVSAVCLSRVRPRQRSAAVLPVEQRRRSVRSELREGYVEVRARSWIWVTLVAFAVVEFAAVAPLFVLGPLVAREQYGHTAVFGIRVAMIGIGTIAGSLIGIGWRPRHPMRMALLLILLWPPSLILYGAGVTLAVVLPAAVLGGAGLALFDTWWSTALAERVPPDRLSRVSSYDWLVSAGLLPAGYVAVGPLGHWLGAAPVLIGGAALGLLAALAALIPHETRMLERTAQSAGHASAP
ncbi:MAG: MFS transporter [Solirubrobacteraceae bacterium]